MTAERCWSCDGPAPAPGSRCEACGAPHCPDIPCALCIALDDAERGDRLYDAERDRLTLEGR